MTNPEQKNFNVDKPGKGCYNAEKGSEPPIEDMQWDACVFLSPWLQPRTGLQ
jgi:hypothetical protein